MNGGVSKTGIAFAALLATSVVAYAKLGYGYYKKLRYKVAKVTFSGVADNGAMQMIISLYVYNPTPVDVTIKSITGTVYLNGKRTGYIDKQEPVTVISNLATLIDIPVYLDAVAASGNLLGNIIRGNQYENQTVGINATLKIGIVPVTLDLNYKLSDLI